MYINPIVIIISAAILFFAIIFCVLNKPKKPILSGVLLILLSFFIASTYMIDITFTSISDQSYKMDLLNKIVCFVTATDTLTEASLEQSFNVFKTFDIVLMGITIIVLILDIRTIFFNSNHIKVESDIEKNTEIQSDQIL